MNFNFKKQLFSLTTALISEMNTTSENSVHIDIVQRLFTFLDCTANSTVTAAWDLLARPLAALCSADKATRKAARAAFDPDRRLTWWFDASLNIALQKRESSSAVHLSTVFELLLGTDHPLYCRLRRRHGDSSGSGAGGDSGEGGRLFKPLLAKAWAKAEQKEAERLAGGFYDALLAEEWAKVAELRAKRERELELKARSRRVIQPYGVPSPRTPDSSSPAAPSPARPRFQAYPFMRYRTGSFIY
jgi:hypothetical protein